MLPFGTFAKEKDSISNAQQTIAPYGFTLCDDPFFLSWNFHEMAPLRPDAEVRGVIVEIVGKNKQAFMPLKENDALGRYSQRGATGQDQKNSLSFICV